jgi:hypothetical protein
MERSLWILLLATAAGLAQTGVGLASQSGQVEGTVYDADSEQPVRGAKLYVSWLRQDAETDAQGHFMFRDVPVGAQNVSVSALGAVQPDATRAITVTAGAVTEHVDFRIWIPGKISGVIRDPDGEAVQGARVTMVERQYMGETYLYETIRSTVTNDLGHYAFSSVRPTREFLVLARVFPEADGVGRGIAAKQRVPVLAPTWYGDSAEPDGAARVRLQSGQEVEGVDIKLRETAALCVSGRLTLFGRPARVEFTVSDEGIRDIPVGGGAHPARGGMSGENGNFALCGLYPGRFRLDAMHRGSGTLPDAYGWKSFVLRDVDVSDFTLDAGQLIDLSGTISVDGSATEPDTRVHVYLQSVDRPRLSPINAERATGLAARSTFTMKTTAETSFVLSVLMGGSKNTYVRDVKYRGVDVTNRAFVPGSGPGLEIVLSTDGGSVNTIVTDEKGLPAAGVTVILVPEGMRSPGELNALARTGISDASGRCGFTNLKPGHYFALATLDPVASQVSQELSPGQRLFPNAVGQLYSVAGRGVEVTVTPKQESSVTLAPVKILQRGR